VPAVILAGVITFSADHSAGLGLVTFGVFAVLSGAVVAAAALRWSGPGVERGVPLVQGGIAIVAGVASLVVPAAGLPYLVFTVTAFAILTGFLELYLGVRGRRAIGGGGVATFARDHIFVGALTVLLAVAVLLVPPGFVQAFTGPDGVERQLTASVVVVGLLGAYWAIAGIYLVIASLSLKWGTDSRLPIPTGSEA
jgi:uncharacterized membrane protein HdeD (DUF308 family)